jgi:two-component system KDP operon response regulator KdpE
VARILVVDDDSSLLKALRLGLRATGHEVFVAVDGEQGLSQSVHAAPDVIVLDLGLPDIDGLTVCRRIRQWSDVPIIVLSANDSESRKVAALDEGADDYVTKPFGMAELEARIRTALPHRRIDSGSPAPAVLAAGTLRLDVARRAVSIDSQPIELTAKEFDLLAYLVRNANKVCTYQMILRAVWGPKYMHESQYVHVYVNRLRQKIRAASGFELKTIPGVGYLLTTPRAAETPRASS